VAVSLLPPIAGASDPIAGTSNPPESHHPHPTSPARRGGGGRIPILLAVRRGGELRKRVCVPKFYVSRNGEVTYRIL